MGDLIYLLGEKMEAVIHVSVFMFSVFSVLSVINYSIDKVKKLY